VKKKISKILGVGLTLALLASLVLAAAPVAASPNVSGVRVELSDYGDAAATVTYYVYFTPGANLTANVDTITVFFPTGTTSIDVSDAARVDQDGDAVLYANTTVTTKSVAGYRFILTTPVNITAGTEARVEIAGITNPDITPATQNFTLKVYTSKETEQVESSTYTIGVTKVTAAKFDPSNGNSTPSAAAAEAGTAGLADDYLVQFTTSGAGALAANWDTITVIFPPDTTVPASIAASNVAINEAVTDSWTLCTVAPSVSGRTVTLTVPTISGQDIGNSEVVRVWFKVGAGIKNPTLATDANNLDDAARYVGKVYTSKDLGLQRQAFTGRINAAPPCALGFEVTSPTSVLVSTASGTITVQSMDQYGNLSDVPVNVDVSLSSSSATGLFLGDQDGDNSLADETWTSTSPFTRILQSGASDILAIFQYKDTTAGTATITASQANLGSATWGITVLPVPVVNLYDGTVLISTYSTIQAAINDALPTNTIKVGAGTYTENLTVNKANLTIESTAGMDSTIIKGKITLDSGADKFVLGGASGKGFTLNSGTVADYLVYVMDGADDVTISYNKLNTTGDADDAIRTYTASDLTVAQNAFTVADLYDQGVRGHVSGGGGAVVKLTVTNNTFTGTSNTLETSAVEINELDIRSLDSLISGNTFTSVGNGVVIGNDAADTGLVSDTSPAKLEISSNTFSGCKYGIDLVNASSTGVNQNVVIKRNTFSNNTYGFAIDYGSFPKDVDNWEPGDFTVKYNNFSSNTLYGVYNNKTEAVDASRNWLGDVSGPSGVGPGSGDAISANVGYDPWLGASVSAGEWATSAASLNAQATVGVKVSGVDNKDIGVARYTANPAGTPEFTPLENGFFDVYVSAAGNATEVGIKLYDAAITTDSKAYVWDAFEEEWKQCTEQSAISGMVWIKARPYSATAPAVPTIQDLAAGLPLAIGGAAAVEDPWVYDTNGDGVIQKSEAVDAVWDYFDGLISKELAIEVLWLYFG